MKKRIGNAKNLASSPKIINEEQSNLLPSNDQIPYSPSYPISQMSQYSLTNTIAHTQYVEMIVIEKSEYSKAVEEIFLIARIRKSLQ